jgi:hypothetical protein
MGSCSYIIGYPGSGKTTLLNDLTVVKGRAVCSNFIELKDKISHYESPTVLRLLSTLLFACILILAFFISFPYNLRRARLIASSVRMYFSLRGAVYSCPVIADENLIHRLFIIFFGVKLFKGNKILLECASVLASISISDLIIMNTPKEECLLRISGRSSPLSRFNKSSDPKVLDQLREDQLYTGIIETLKKRYPEKVYEY